MNKNYYFNGMTIILSVILAFLASSVFAKPISQDEAQIIAVNLAKNKHQVKLKSKKARSFQQRMASPSSGITESSALYYVFDIGENNGFAIIAGDDVFKPLIGIAESGSFDYANMPPNFAWYLQNLEREMNFALDNGQAINYSSAPYTTGSYLIQTTWAQSAPYNDMCPKISGAATVAGCVAITMSQIMNYHQWPVSISGEIPEYTTRTQSISVPTISRNGFSYNWANMANSYSGTTTAAQKTAVATLVYHAGAAAQMNYGTSSSGAFGKDIAQIMSHYFDYDSNAKFITKNGRYYRPEDYSQIGSSSWLPSNDSIMPYIWEDVMRLQIDSLLPVLYSGESNDASSAHSFILDGYNASGQFHFNWGWNGQYDGWFTISVLTPGTTHDYNYGQDAVINIMPNLYGAGNSDLRIFGKNLSVSNSSVARGEPFKVSATIYNIGTATLPRGKTLGIAILSTEDENDFEIIGTVTLDSIMSFNRARELTTALYLRSDYSLEIESFVLNTQPGDYVLKAAIKNENGEWEFIKSAKSYSDYVNIEVNEDIVSDNSVLEICKAITFTSDDGNFILQNKPLEVSVGIRNTGTGSFIGKINAELGDELSGMEKVGDELVIIPVSNTCKTITINSSNIVSEDGYYTLSVISENFKGEKNTLKPGLSVFVWNGSSCKPTNRCGNACMEPPLEYCINGEVKIKKTFVDARDGQTYTYVTINNQTWMAENLNYAGEDEEIGICYGNNDSNCEKYGRLYNWATAMAFSNDCNTESCAGQIASLFTHNQGICPEDWHVPSTNDWQILVNFAGGNSVAGDKLKATLDWTDGNNGTDDYGFAALPSGSCLVAGCYAADIGTRSYWWEAAEATEAATNAISRGIGATQTVTAEAVTRYTIQKTRMLSLRCIKDIPEAVPVIVRAPQTVNYQNASVFVYNIKGNLVAKSETYKNINSFALPAGIYFVEIKGEGFNQRKKAVVW